MNRSVKKPEAISTDRLLYLIEASRKLAEKSDRIRHESAHLRAYSWSLILESQKLKLDAGAMLLLLCGNLLDEVS